MKHNQLVAIAHNLADSMACGLCFVIGMFEVRIFEEAARNAPSGITVDFLNGTITEGVASPSLSRAVELFREALPAFCEKHGASVDDFREMTVQFLANPQAPAFVVTVGDRRGRRTETRYSGIASRRLKVLDDRGRIRPAPQRRLPAASVR